MYTGSTMSLSLQWHVLPSSAGPRIPAFKCLLVFHVAALVLLGPFLLSPPGACRQSLPLML